MTTYHLRDLGNCDDNGNPFEFDGDAEQIATYLDGAIRADTLPHVHPALEETIAAIRRDGAVSEESMARIRVEFGVFVSGVIDPYTPTTEQVRAAYIEHRERATYSPSVRQERRYEQDGGAAGEFDRWIASIAPDEPTTQPTVEEIADVIARHWQQEAPDQEDLTLAASIYAFVANRPDLTPCAAEVHSWAYFRPGQVDAYWIKCDRTGPHDEHEDEYTGLRWRDQPTTPEVTP